MAVRWAYPLTALRSFTFYLYVPSTDSVNIVKLFWRRFSSVFLKSRQEHPSNDILMLWHVRTVCIIRSPGTTVPDELMFYPGCFFFFCHAFSEITRPIALKLCHVIRIWPYFISWLQKFGGGPPKNLGPKTCKISVNFGTLQTLISNISGMRQHMQIRKDVRTLEIPPAFNEKSPVNFGPLTAWNYMWVWTH